MKKKVYLALSGGVDSSVAAALLLEKGFDVWPVFLKCWSREAAGLDGVGECSWKEDSEFAFKVCQKLGIENKFQSFNFEKEFWQEIVNYYIEEHKAGKTPNPDIVCNEKIKFSAFFNLAIEKGADFVATGHYARVKKTKEGFLLLRAKCHLKNDQSYFLYRISQKQLSRVLFPIGEFESKEKVRKLAKKLNLPTAERKSTRGICFVGKKNSKDLLFNFISPHPGFVMTKEGKTVGRHLGVEFYTLGQRRGIGVFGGQEKPLYILEKDLERNFLIVGEKTETLKEEVFVSNLHWILKKPRLSLNCFALLRHPQEKFTPCVISETENGLIKVIFKEPQFSLAEGQSIVFYQKEVVLGGGIISKLN